MRRLFNAMFDLPLDEFLVDPAELTWSNKAAFSGVQMAQVEDEDKEVVVTLELPGVKKDDVSVRLNNGELKIAWKRGLKDGTAKEYSKIVVLPRASYAGGERPSGSLKDGILVVRIPKCAGVEVEIE